MAKKRTEYKILVPDYYVHKDTAYCFEEIQMLINVNAEPLEPAASIPYLVCTVAYNNNDWVDLYQNLKKARWRWEMLSKVVTKTGQRCRRGGFFIRQ